MYGLGFIMALVLGGQLFRIRNILAHAFGTVMFAWALNCGVLFAMLFLKLEGVDWFAVAAAPAWLINATILALVPLAVYLVFIYLNGRARSDS